MALTLDLQHDLGRPAAWSAAFAKQLPFAVAGALNDTAFDVRANTLPGATRQFFDRPTPFIEKGWRVDRANKSNLAVTIGAENKRVRVIRRQIQGGQRLNKGFERVFAKSAPDRQVRQLVPAAVKLNRYGNVSLAEIKRLQADFGTGRGGVFYGKPSGGGLNTDKPVGIYRRSREQLFPYFVALRNRATYRPRFKMAEAVGKAYERRYGGYLRSSLERALATAR